MEENKKEENKIKNDKKKILIIVAAVILVLAVILIVVFTNKSQSANKKPSSSLNKTTTSQTTKENKTTKESTTTTTAQKETSTTTKKGSTTIATVTTTKNTYVHTSGTPFATHGRLSVSGTRLVDKNGTPFQLKGVSTHGIGWFPQYVNREAFQTIRDDWGANLVRLAMYTGEGGYCTGGNQAALEATIDKGVATATELGMYVIIDWHILSDGNPNTYVYQSKEFFAKMSAKYKNNGNVLYEICNEPNGGTSWNDIKTYADQVIPVIRANDPNAIILVGTPTWSQDVDLVAANPVAQPHNVMYTVHFYAATHKDYNRNKVKTAISSGTPVFVSEFSICDASGNGDIDYASAEEWKSLINSNNLSYAGWSFCNKAETSALINSGCQKTSGWVQGDLSNTGNWLRTMMRG